VAGPTGLEHACDILVKAARWIAACGQVEAMQPAISEPTAQPHPPLSTGNGAALASPTGAPQVALCPEEQRYWASSGITTADQIKPLWLL
jgi:hypothetical protein